MKKFRLPRRAFVRGAGAGSVALALPTLEAMLDSKGRYHATARAQAQVPPPKLILMYIPNGLEPDQWVPSETGYGYAPSPALSAIPQTLRQHINVFSQLDNRPASGSQNHSTTYAFCGGEGAASQRTSLEHYLIRKSDPGTKLKSMTIDMFGETVNEVDKRKSTKLYTAWSDGNTPVAGELSPDRLFKRVFGDIGSDVPDSPNYGKSLLDSSIAETKQLMSKLGGSDRQTLEAHLDLLRQLEQESVAVGGACARPEVSELDIGSLRRLEETHDQRVQQFFDIMVAGLRCGVTRYVNFSFGQGMGSFRIRGQGDHIDNHSCHGFSHWYNADTSSKRESRREGLELVGKYYMEKFSQLLERLVQPPSMLPNTLVFCTHEQSKGHSTHNVPMFLAGNVGGIKTGKHIRSSKGTPHANLLTSIVHAMGYPGDKFGYYHNGDLDAELKA